MTETTLKRGRIVLGGGGRTSTTPRGFGCHCAGPAYGTPYCPCELAHMQAQADEGLEDDDYEDRKK